MSDSKAKEEGSSERRVAPRIRTLRRAQILLNNRFSTIDCVVRNVSATGALLTVDSVVQLPPTFEIKIGEDGEAQWAKLVYRREMFAGIHFLDKQEAASAGRTAQASANSSAPVETAAVERIVGAPLPATIRRHFAWNVFLR